MQFRTKLAAAWVLATCTLGVDSAPAESQPLPAPPSRPALLRIGHDGIDVDRALKRYAGMVTALGTPDREGRIYSFQASPLPAAPDYVPNELRGGRLTVLAGKRFAAVFEVLSNTESEITVTPLDGPLHGLAVRDLFVVEQIAIERQQPSGETGSKPSL
jgi:hypothetical protein